MKFIKKLIATIKLEPVVAAGGVVGAASAVVTWAQSNQITTLRQLLQFSAPIAVSYVVRVFVTPNSKVALTVVQVEALKAAERPPGINTPTGTPPNTPPAV